MKRGLFLLFFVFLSVSNVFAFEIPGIMWLGINQYLYYRIMRHKIFFDDKCKFLYEGMNRGGSTLILTANMEGLRAAIRKGPSHLSNIEDVDCFRGTVVMSDNILSPFFVMDSSYLGELQKLEALYCPAGKCLTSEAMISVIQKSENEYLVKVSTSNVSFLLTIDKRTGKGEVNDFAATFVKSEEILTKALQLVPDIGSFKEALSMIRQLQKNAMLQVVDSWIQYYLHQMVSKDPLKYYFSPVSFNIFFDVILGMYSQEFLDFVYNNTGFGKKSDKKR